MAPELNVLLVVFDQRRWDALRGGLAAHVPTPHLDAFAAQGVVFDNHWTVTVPCGPARASLLTGRYAANHSAVRNGAPLPRFVRNLGHEARRIGYEPLLFGYTDSQPDPTDRAHADPDNAVYENVMPGWRELCVMRLEHGVMWPAHLRAQATRFQTTAPAPWTRCSAPRAASPSRPRSTPRRTATPPI